MKPWIKTGLIWGGFMYIAMTIVFPLIDGDLSWTEMLIGIPFWAACGLIYGYIVRGRSMKKTNEKA